MADYTSQVLINVNPNSSYGGLSSESSSLVVQWNYPNCEKSWFRVSGECFQPPTRDGCPPYPNPGSAPVNCLVEEFSLTGLFNTGLNSDGGLLAECSEDRHGIILPSQYPFVVDQSSVPPGLTAPTANSQYIGLACNGSVPANSTYTFRFFFVMPVNVAATTFELEITLDSPNRLVGISINGHSASLASDAPLVAKSFLLAGFFISDVNYIDVTLSSPSVPSPGYMALMARFPVARACTSNGNFAPGVNTGCRVNLTSNVLACDAEDVCRILKARGIVFPIKSIKKIDSTSLDYNCYTDVTPDLEDCVECCDFLIDENLDDDWYGFCNAIEQFEYVSDLPVRFAPVSRARIVFKYNNEFNLQFAPQSEEQVIYNSVESNFNFSLSPESVLSRPEWAMESIASISFDPRSIYSSDSYAFVSSMEFSFAPRSVSTPKTRIRGSTLISIRPNSSYQQNNFYRSIFTLNFDSSSEEIVPSYLHDGQVRIGFAPSSVLTSSSWSYASVFNFSLNPVSQRRWEFSPSTDISFAPRSNYTVVYFGTTEASLLFGPRSEVPSSTSWSWPGDTQISLYSLTTYISSDLGTLETDAYSTSTATEQPVVFQNVPAPALSTAISSISIPGCCPLVLERLQFRHNLGSIPRFSNFLKRNGLVLPGQLIKGRSSTFIPVTYSARQGQWTGSLYLEGLSASQAGRESWNLSIEFGCETNWRIAVRLFRSSVNSDGSFRLVANYPVTTVCPNQSGFQGFSAAVSTAGVISAPAASNLVINDEDDVAQTVPAALLLQFSIETSGLQITFPVDLEKQLKAATAALF